MAGKTVRIWEGVDKFGLIFMDDNMEVVFRESTDFPFAFQVKVYCGDELVEKDLVRYDDVNVNDIAQLKERLLENPEKVLEEVLGREFKVEKIVSF